MFYILFAIGVGAAAINTGNNLLYLILGILLGFIVISGFLSDSGLWRIRTEWHPIGSLYAGERAAFECRVNKRWFPGVAVTIASRWHDGQTVTGFAPWIPVGDSIPLRFNLVPTKRGYLELESCVYSTRFPFGLFQKIHTRPAEERWVVFPRTQVLPRQVFENVGEEGSRETAERVGRGSVPYVLRDYRSGDALRQVHWKASAKRQRLIVKDMEDELSRGDLFVLDAWPAGLPPETLERLISFIASAVYTVHQAGRPVGLAAPEAIFRPASSRSHLHRILEYLALVEPGRPRSPDGRRKISLRPGDRAIDLVKLWDAWGGL